MMENPGLVGRNAAFFVYRDLQRGVRTADGWKHIQYQVDGIHTEQLFDLNTDPYETQDLAADSMHGTKLSEMRELLIQESTRWFDPLDLNAPDWGL